MTDSDELTDMTHATVQIGGETHTVTDVSIDWDVECGAETERASVPWKTEYNVSLSLDISETDPRDLARLFDTSVVVDSGEVVGFLDLEMEKDD